MRMLRGHIPALSQPNHVERLTLHSAAAPIASTSMRLSGGKAVFIEVPLRNWHRTTSHPPAPTDD